MGNSRSYESRSTLTAKLILLDGQLQQFSWPVRVSSLLQQNSDCFICSSDEMEFGEFAEAMSGDKVLRPGELYFELPQEWRNQRLQAEDMAVLAAKASAALAGDDGDDDEQMINCGCSGRRKVEPVVLFCVKERPLLAVEEGGESDSAGGCKRRKFVGKLSAIVEE
ncbi:hypothetical protein CDL12_05155 [Handroanthus impetiginosus]|uniref:Uncharacterized protein n=1 Tax=Handroanthus impetiginosus TaxID=429701 RepID=A0A2G9HX98_9LAMI|nr:hypothetical protein CDL12_05155 [Handroanthus impetiginosus]